MSTTRIPLRAFRRAAGEPQWNVTVIAQQREDGTWSGALEFRSGTERRVAEGETSQPNLDAVTYWSTGLEDVYLEGALDRARPAPPA